VYNVYVTASDLAANAGTKGHLTDPSKTSAILFEKDTGVGAPAFTPGATTDDPNAFIVIDYAAEGVEYGLTGVCTAAAVPYPGCTGVGAPAAGAFTIVAANVATDKDTHGKVTLTSAILDGVDILADVVTEDNIKFLYKASGLALGNHTIKVKATDDSGNKSLEISNTFKVVAVKAFEVKLLPGWNLISIPGAPADPSVNSVIGAGHPVAAILTYDAGSGVWMTAVRDTDSGLFMGTLTTISATQAYWVSTDSFQSVNVTLAAAPTGMVPPSISLGAGWTMVPVVTPNPRGTTVGFGVAPATYLPVGWVRAYGYNTLTGAFVSITPGDGQLLTAGQGYWVYMTKAGVIIP